jgi:WD40 repeat protein
MNQRTRSLLLAVLAVLFVAALVIALVVKCGPAQPDASPTPSSASTPSSPTSAPIPTWTPTPVPIPLPQLPVLAGTPVPIPEAPITPENASDVTELAMWGKGEALDVTYSPDGRLLALGSTVGIWLYDTETLNLARFIRTMSKVDSVAFTPDSATVFGRVSDISIGWWNVATGELLGRLEVGAGEVAFSLDNATLVAVAQDHQIDLWNIEKGEHLHAWEESLGLAGAMTFSPDGTLLATGSSDDTIIRLWDTQTGQPVRILEGHTERVGSLAFSPDGSQLASGSADDTVRMWDVETGAVIALIEGHDKSPSHWIKAVAFSPNGEKVASGATDNTLRTWDAKTGERLCTFEHASTVTGASFSPDGKLLASIGVRGQDVQVWGVETGVLAHTVEESGRWLAGRIISPDGTVFVTRGTEIEQLDLETGRAVRTFEGHTSDAGNLTLSADGSILASSETWDLAVWIWDVDTGTSRRFPGPYATFVRDVALSPDGSMFAASSDSEGFSIYNARSGEHVHAFGGGRSCDLTFSADDTRLLSASFYADGVYLWEVATGERRRTFELPGQYSRKSVALSPDGTLAGGGYGGRDMVVRYGEWAVGLESEGGHRLRIRLRLLP